MRVIAVSHLFPMRGLKHETGGGTIGSSVRETTLLARRDGARYLGFGIGKQLLDMITPFEHRVKNCIEGYQRLRIIHEELNKAARDFKSAHWTPAFDHNGRFIGMLLTENGRELLASDSSVRIGNREWR